MKQAILELIDRKLCLISGGNDEAYIAMERLLQELREEIEKMEKETKVTDEDCIKFLKKSIESNPVQVLIWLLVNIGDSMAKSNADNLETSANMNDPRGGKMKVEMKIEKLQE